MLCPQAELKMEISKGLQILGNILLDTYVSILDKGIKNIP